MPLYEYQCDACGNRFEKIQKFSDPPPDTCPSCGGSVKKLLSSPAIQFKGTGWYITDYAKKSSPDSSGGGSKASSDASAEKSSDKTGGDSTKGDSAKSDSATTTSTTTTKE